MYLFGGGQGEGENACEGDTGSGRAAVSAAAVVAAGGGGDAPCAAAAGPEGRSCTRPRRAGAYMTLVTGCLRSVCRAPVRSALLRYIVRFRPVCTWLVDSRSFSCSRDGCLIVWFVS